MNQIGQSKSTKKKNIRLNWMDLLVFLLIVASVIALVIRYWPGENGINFLSGKKVMIEYTVQIDKVSNQINLSLRSGDEAVDLESKESIGTLASNPMIVAYQETVFNEQSVGIEIVNSENYSTVYLTIVAEAIEHDTGYYVNGVRIAVGAEYSLRLTGIEAKGNCIGIEFIDGQN